MTKAKQKEAFGRRVTKLMRERRLTVRKLAEFCGVHPSVVQGWKVGVLSTDYAALCRASTVLGCSLEYLLCGVNSSKPGVADVLVDGGMLFDGYARVTIQKLLLGGETSES